VTISNPTDIDRAIAGQCPATRRTTTMAIDSFVGDESTYDIPGESQDAFGTADPYAPAPARPDAGGSAGTKKSIFSQYPPPRGP
jgi:hypothetical protein